MLAICLRLVIWIFGCNYMSVIAVFVFVLAGCCFLGLGLFDLFGYYLIIRCV